MNTIRKMFNFVREMQKKIKEIVIKISNNTAFFSYQVDKIDSLIIYNVSEGMGNNISFAGNVNDCSLWGMQFDSIC